MPSSIDIDNENVSSLLIDYSLLNSFIQSNKFEKSLELYSILSNISSDNHKNISLKILLEEILIEKNFFSLNEFRELIKIFQKLNIDSLINSYDLINQFYLNNQNKLINKQSSIYLSKLLKSNLNRLKIICLEKYRNEILGLTIRYASLDDHRILIGRTICGTISENVFSCGDELIEINNIPIQSNSKTLNQIIEFINCFHGYISFTILSNDQHIDKHSSFYVRSLFSYNPKYDFYNPCKELALHFKKHQILKIHNCDDPLWWQATIVISNNNQKQVLPRLIPSEKFQKKRFKFINSFDDQQKIKLHFYERVKWFIPNENCKRPIILIGSLNLIKHKFIQDLRNCNELSSLIDIVIPYTTRLKKDYEIDGIHFHFLTDQQFQNHILNNYFIQYGLYKESLYGISKLSIQKSCQILNKISILNLLPEEINRFKYSNIYPYVIYLELSLSSFGILNNYLNINEEQFTKIKQIEQNIKKNYSNLIDKTISLNKPYQTILSQLKFIIKDIQKKPMWINESYFPIKDLFNEI